MTEVGYTPQFILAVHDSFGDILWFEIVYIFRVELYRLRFTCVHLEIHQINEAFEKSRMRSIKSYPY